MNSPPLVEPELIKPPIVPRHLVKPVSINPSPVSKEYGSRSTKPRGKAPNQPRKHQKDRSLVTNPLARASALDHLARRDRIKAVSYGVKRGMTQVELAEKLQTSQPTISRIIKQLTAIPKLENETVSDFICEAFVMELSRDYLIQTLKQKFKFVPGEVKNDVYQANTIDELTTALNMGWLTKAEYDELAAN